MSETDKRLTDLEVKVAFQEDLLAKLDEVLRTVRDEVEGLRRDMDALREAVERQAPDATDEPPPHY
ncbi:MAG: SlyX family protein [Myxococcota bacterium]